MSKEIKMYAINADTLFKSIIFTIFFVVVLALIFMQMITDIKQDINVIRVEVNGKLDKDDFNKHMSEFSVNNEKTLFNEQVIIKGLNMDSETFHKYFIERNNDGKRQ